MKIAFLLIEFCNGCFADYLEMERLKSFEYTNGIIEIHKIETQDDNSANNSDSEVSNIYYIEIYFVVYEVFVFF